VHLMIMQIIIKDSTTILVTKLSNQFLIIFDHLSEDGSLKPEVSGLQASGFRLLTNKLTQKLFVYLLFSTVPLNTQ